jgi:hypothetical protein
LWAVHQGFLFIGIFTIRDVSITIKNEFETIRKELEDKELVVQQ